MSKTIRPKVVILFGEMGAGKNYHGSRIAAERKLSFLDGDTVMPPEMAERVKAFKPLSGPMLAEFIHHHLLMAIIDKARGTRGVVVAQALYRRFNRSRLESQLGLMGYDPEFIHIKVPFMQNLRQLWSRPKGHLWVAYWLMNKPFFQHPEEGSVY